MKMKKRIIIALAAAVVLTMVAGWNHWRAGKVMARARNTDRKFYNEILVREIKSDPLAILLPADSACYQCEFHRPGCNRPWSYQTYTGDSFLASRARIIWTNENEATVYLDDYPVFKCVDGWWTKP